jgi:hypothetical protein
MLFELLAAHELCRGLRSLAAGDCSPSPADWCTPAAAYTCAYQQTGPSPPPSTPRWTASTHYRCAADQSTPLPVSDTERPWRSRPTGNPSMPKRESATGPDPAQPRSISNPVGRCIRAYCARGAPCGSPLTFPCGTHRGSSTTGTAVSAGIRSASPPTAPGGRAR